LPTVFRRNSSVWFFAGLKEFFRMHWEYMTIEYTLDQSEMNRLGMERWELVCVVSPAHFVLHYFFKRQAVP
jgi:hypothetical protein